MLDGTIPEFGSQIKFGDLLGGSKDRPQPGADPQRETCPDTASEATAFLTALDPNGWHNLVAIDPNSGRLHGRTFAPDSWFDIDAWIRERVGQLNLYFTVNEPTPDASHSSLKKHEIARIRAVFTDCDFRDRHAAADERSRLDRLVQSLGDSGLKPTTVIESGGGIQCFWRLAEKLDVAEHGKWAENQGRALALRMGGDTVQNLNRFMRLPGTVNLPNADKLARGRTAAPARVIATGGPRWAREQLQALLPPVAGDSADTSPRVNEVKAELEAERFDEAIGYEDLEPELRARFEALCATDEGLRNAWRGEPLKGSDQSGSAYRAKLASHLGRASGFGAIDYARLAWVCSHTVQAHHDRDVKLTARALARDWVRVGERADVALQHFDAEAAAAPPSPQLSIKPADDVASIEWISPPTWEGQPEKPAEWLVRDWIPHRQVTLLYGDGGVGKTLIAQQLATAIATGRDWLGQRVQSGRVMCFFCEDSADELHRRQAAINRAMGITHSDLDKMSLVSRVEADNMLATYDRSGTMTLRPIFARLLADAQDFGADLIIIDTLADTFDGNEIDRAQVSSFVKRCLGGLARGINGSVLALGHPSQSGMSSGSGTSGSGAWNNACRSRLYLISGANNVRELKNQKQNYGPRDAKLKFEWRKGAFEIIAGTSNDPEASIAAFPKIDDAAEDAVVRAVAACRGVRMSAAKTSRYAAHKILTQLQPELLKAFSTLEVQGAVDRLLRSDALAVVSLGKDNNFHSIFGLAVNADKLSPHIAPNDDLFN